MMTDRQPGGRWTATCGRARRAPAKRPPPAPHGRGFRARARAIVRAFTLLEAMMASSILVVVVMGVTSAITAGQQHAYEAHQRIAATLAADELMGRLMTVDYTDLSTWNGFNEDVGTMTDGEGRDMPPAFDMVGRRVRVTGVLQGLPGIDVRVSGRVVEVETINATGRVLCALTHFIAEPQS